MEVGEILAKPCGAGGASGASPESASAARSAPNAIGPAGAVPVTPAELVKLGAGNPEFYAKAFFPKTFRQASPSFAAEL
jgi:hypothetical protein